MQYKINLIIILLTGFHNLSLKKESQLNLVRKQPALYVATGCFAMLVVLFFRSDLVRIYT